MKNPLVRQFRGQAQIDVIDGVGNYETTRITMQRALAALNNASVFATLRFGSMFGYKPKDPHP